MIHYSSIKDAWGKKDMFKNNISSGKFTNTLEPVTNCQTSIKEQNVQPTSPPETFVVKESINLLENIKKNEHFTENNCAFMEHLQNCPFCMAKLKNTFTENFTSSIREDFIETTSSVIDKPISTINLFGLEINITKDVLKVLFIIILIIIFILLLRMVNVSFKNTNNKYLNMPNEEMIRLMTQMKYFTPTI